MCRSGDEASEASSETFDKFTHLSIHVVPAMPGSLWMNINIYINN